MKRASGIWIVLALALGGCQSLPLTDDARGGHELRLAVYAQQFASLKAEARQHELQQARAAHERRETAATNARLGLALGQAGYAGHDAQAARDHLQKALSAPDADWSAEERAFLSLRTYQIKRATAQRAAMQQELKALTAANQKLQRQIAEAERKLHAITEIEQDIGRHRRNP